MVENMSEFPETNPPAFPRNYDADGHNGLSLRDWFAGLAMQGLIANRGTSYWKDTPAIAYTMADALLAERQKGGDA